MDDANLKKLSVDQAGMVPEFVPDFTDYKIVVASNVEVLKVSATTSDNGASFSLKSDKTGWADMGELKLAVGANKLTIEVTSEDGTVKKYSIDCCRLSASSATLKSITFTDIQLEPTFETDVFEYETVLNSVPYTQLQAHFSYEIFDPNCVVKVTSNNQVIDKTDDGGLLCSVLNYGFTEINLNVTSPDKSNIQDYKIQIVKNTAPRLASFIDTKDKQLYEDPISLAPIYCAFKINKTGYSLPFIDLFQKISSSDQLNEISLSVDENQQASKLTLFNHMLLENSISNALVKMPMINGACSGDIALRTSSQLSQDLNEMDVMGLPDAVKEYTPPEDIASIESLPKAEVRPWEKQLQNIYDETDPDVLVKNSQEHFEKYKELIASAGIHKARKLDKILDEASETSPLFYLNLSISNMATAIKFKSKDTKNHIRLAMLLEEKNLFENLYGRPVKEDHIVDTLGSQNKAAADSSKEEDIAAICVLRGYGPNPIPTDILKALDQEYHYCLETGQNHKADQVQGLYLFKSKKISDNMMQSTSSESNDRDGKELLKKANLKYQDTMSLFLDSHQTNFTTSLHVGRSLCLIGDFKQALCYLKGLLNWAEDDFKVLATFYYAYALSKKGDKLDQAQAELVCCYLGRGLMRFISRHTNQYFCPSRAPTLFSEDYFSIFNTEFLEAFLIIGRLRSEFEIKVEIISSENAYRYCAWLCCTALNELNKMTKICLVWQDSKLIKDIIRLLMEAHTRLIRHGLINLVGEEYQSWRPVLAKQCVGLLNILRASANREDEEVLRHQERIAQYLVYSDPLDPYNLLLLGCAKFELSQFLHENKKEIYEKEYFDGILSECENLLQASAALQGNKTTHTVPVTILGHKWWNRLHEALVDQSNKIKEALLKKNAPPPQAAAAKPIPAKKPAPAAVKATPAKAVPAQKAPAGKPIPAGKGPAAAKPPVNASKNKLETAKSREEETPVNVKPVDEAPVATVEEKLPIHGEYSRGKTPSYNVFVVFYHTQLNLARVYARQENWVKATEYYKEVINKDPKKHDGYIELASMLKKNGDLVGAVDVYSSFPVTEPADPKDKRASDHRPPSVTNPPIQLLKRKKKENNLFDDAFIYGELIRILMNEKKYDDPRLAKYLILWAKIMGTGIIDKDVHTLNLANKTKVCKEVYAGVHNKPIDDPDLVQFFAFKGW